MEMDETEYLKYFYQGRNKEKCEVQTSLRVTLRIL